MAEALRLEDLTIRLRGGERDFIVNSVSLSIALGEAYGLVGESGCGKSTIGLAIMRYLPGAMVIDRGRILIEGRDLAAMNRQELRRMRGGRVAMVYQDPASSLNPTMTIGRQLI